MDNGISPCFFERWSRTGHHFICLGNVYTFLFGNAVVVRTCNAFVVTLLYSLVPRPCPKSMGPGNEAIPSVLPLADQPDLDHFCDCLRTHKCHGLSWPKGMTEDLYEQSWMEFSWQFYNSFKYPSLPENAQVGIGFLLNDIWQVILHATGAYGR